MGMAYLGKEAVHIEVEWMKWGQKPVYGIWNLEEGV